MTKAGIRAFDGDSPRLRNLSFGIVLFGFVLIFFTWLTLSQAIEHEIRQDIESAVKDTANLARAFEEHTLRTIKAADQAAWFLKYQYEREGRTIDIPQYIKEGRLQGDPFVFLGVADENGDLAVSSQVPFVPSNVKDREHFLVHKDHDIGHLFISKPVFGRSSGKWVIQMSRRVDKPDGSFGGIVVVSVDPFYFSEFYKQVDLGKNSSINLVGRDGIVHARQAGEDTVFGQDISGSLLLEKMTTSDSGHYVENSKIDGISRIYSFRALRAYPFAVVVGVDRNEIIQGAKERMDHFFPMTVLISVGVIVCMVMLIRFIGNQKRYEEELRQAHDELESKVRLRTQELFALNEELTTMNEEYLAINEELQNTNQELQNEVAERRRTEKKLNHKNDELRKAYTELKSIKFQVIQQDKMASIGQLAAGVAHEINNPTAYIISNLESLRDYVGRLAQFITTQEEAMAKLARADGAEDCRELAATLADEVEGTRRSLKIDYIIHDMESLIEETLDGAGRVKNIVQDLRGFARAENDNKPANINDGIESAINIIWNEMKYKATLEKDLGELPLTKCNLGQLNQVFMNVLLNAVQAIVKRGEISIKSWAESGNIYVTISDTGCGIPRKILDRIFEPFFTTKEVGKGTGLGLSVTYEIIKKHGGEIYVDSEVGVGTTFTIVIPIDNG